MDYKRLPTHLFVNISITNMDARVVFVLLFIVLCVNTVFCAVAADDDRNAIARGFDPKSMLASLAGSLMSRGYAGLPGGIANGGSQVVSLNLTNLVVLVLLKALIFAAGSLGAGSWKGGFGRSSDGEETILTDEEILLYLSYLTGSPGANGCLQKIACHQPLQARRYAAAGEMLLKTAKTMSLQPDQKYEYVLQELQEAANWGAAGGGCERFACGSEDNKLTGN